MPKKLGSSFHETIVKMRTSKRGSITLAAQRLRPMPQSQEPSSRNLNLEPNPEIMKAKRPSRDQLIAWISTNIKRTSALVSPVGAAALALGILLPAGAAAGAMHWTGGYTGGNGSTWQNAANWVEATTYQAGSDVIFADSNINNKPTTWLGSSRTVKSITFANNCVAAFNVSVSAAQAGGTAATLTFIPGNAGIIIESGDTFAHSIGVAANPASGSDVILQDNLMVTHQGSATFTILRPITSPSGVFGVTKTGTGVMLLSGPNSYAGDTIISAGTLQLGTGNNLPDGPAKGNVFVDAAGTLDVHGQTETINGLSGTGIVDNDNPLSDQRGNPDIKLPTLVEEFCKLVYDLAHVCLIEFCF